MLPPQSINIINIKKNDKILFEQDTKYNVLLIDYCEIWEKIETINHTNYDQTKLMIDEWFKDDNLSVCSSFLNYPYFDVSLI